MYDRHKKVVSRSALFGGIVLVLLGAFLVWASWTGIGADGDPAYFTVLLVLGGSMVAQGWVLWLEFSKGGATRSTDGAMFLVLGLVLACLAWLVLNTDRVQVVQMTNGEVSFTSIHEDVAVGFTLLMLLAVYDILSRLYRRNERAILNTAPSLTGPEAGP